MRGINDACIDLIYLDPPFKSDAKYGEIFDPENEEKREIFRDIWDLKEYDLAWWGKIKEDNEGLYYYLGSVREIHSRSMMSYLIYMAMRIIQMHRILKPTGSIYLHCDHHASHYLKPLMDSIFGWKNFINEIVWCYPPGGRGPKGGFHRKHDVILYYSKIPKNNTFIRPYTDITKSAAKKFTKTDEDGRKYKEYPGGRSYLDESPGRPVPDWWVDINSLGQTISNEKTDYPTQKPFALLNRIILASSKVGDMVLDPFCGCATTCEAADNHGRQWVGIDISPEAVDEVKKRIETDIFRMNFKQYNTLPILTDRKPSKPYNHPDNIIVMYGRQGGHCFLCYKHREPDLLCVDHIVAKSKGGSDFLDNLQLVCPKCNSSKGSKTNEEALAEQWKKDGTQWEKRKYEAEKKILIALKKKSKSEII